PSLGQPRRQRRRRPNALSFRRPNHAPHRRRRRRYTPERRTTRGLRTTRAALEQTRLERSASRFHRCLPTGKTAKLRAGGHQFAIVNGTPPQPPASSAKPSPAPQNQRPPSTADTPPSSG